MALASPALGRGPRLHARHATQNNLKKEEGENKMITINQFVEREIIYNVSTLVHSFPPNSNYEDELLSIISKDDWATPAEEYIWNDMPISEKVEYLLARGFDAKEEGADVLDTAIIQDLKDENEFQDFCEAKDLDPKINKAYEHWIVSDWLAEQLKAKGEMVLTDFMGLTIWGRCTTDQPISMDGVIQEIYAELSKK
jgi:hypothetical protein